MPAMLITAQEADRIRIQSNAKLWDSRELISCVFGVIVRFLIS
jgi:hypothetical protein